MNCLRYPGTPCHFRCTDFCRLPGIGYPKDRGGPLFLPSDLAGLALWLRYGDATAVAWPDASGNGRTLTHFNSPTVSADGVTYNGTTQHGKCDAFALAQPETIYLLGRQITYTSPERIFDGEAVGSGIMFQNTNTPALSLNAGITRCTNTDWILNTDAVVCAVFNAGSSLIQVNNNAAATSAGSVGENNMGGFTLGASAGATLFSNIRIKEVIVYAAAHDAGQRAKVSEYLARVGNLTI